MSELWYFRYESPTGRGMSHIAVPRNSTASAVQAAIVAQFPAWNVWGLGCGEDID